jgi:pimeloyl-ACP methyl ester carboxylesterase
MPVLLLVGAHDTKYRTIAADIVVAVGANATVSVVPDAGHALLLERPEEVAAEIAALLQNTCPVAEPD